MKLQRLLSLTRKAIDDYQMIQENDKIAVGISGGKMFVAADAQPVVRLPQGEAQHEVGRVEVKYAVVVHAVDALCVVLVAYGRVSE